MQGYFPPGYSSFWHCCMEAKDFVWLDSMLRHMADPINAKIGGDNSQIGPYGE